MARAGRPWRWVSSPATSQGVAELVNGYGMVKATIWQNSQYRFTWSTWDDFGTGGENDMCSTLDEAKDQCVAAIVRQGFAPGGWRVAW